GLMPLSDSDGYLIDFFNSSFGLIFMAVDLSPAPAPVPVPAAVWLFGSGLIGLIGVARNNKRKQ
ncbi:MAG: VPLPA-CTERM sorting domain-containing protein, partial [Gammaproteobacteria bacterium]|nr:VPLPA-CTERM sorting domain-containing protein [Gammaproteobacteria bacterium]